MVHDMRHGRVLLVSALHYKMKSFITDIHAHTFHSPFPPYSGEGVSPKPDVFSFEWK